MAIQRSGLITTLGLVALLATAAHGAPTVRDFFRPAPNRAADLPDDQLYPRGRQFLFSFFSLHYGRDRMAYVEEAVAAGCTVIGPDYGNYDDALAAAEQVGVKYFFPIGWHPQGGHKSLHFVDDSYPEFDPDVVREAVAAKVASYADREGIAGWYLIPEEMRWWRVNEMQFMQAAYEGAKQGDPKRRPVWMYEPNNRNAESLARTILHQDICGKGIYTNYAGKQTERIWVRWSIEQEVAAIAAAGRDDAIAIAVPEMFQQPDDDVVHMVPAWARHDAYLSLVSGARGIIVYSAAHRSGFTARDAYFEAYAQVCRELNGDMRLGQVFLFGDKRDDLTVRVIDGPATVTLTKSPSTNIASDALTYPSVSVLAVAYGNARYLFAVNSANEPVHAVVDGLPFAGFAAESLFDDDEPKPGRGNFATDFGPLQVKAWRFTAQP
jgi:hypothetical protein